MKTSRTFMPKELEESGIWQSRRMEFDPAKRRRSSLARVSHQHSSQFGQTVSSDAEENPEGGTKLTLPDALKADDETDGQSGRMVGEKCGLTSASWAMQAGSKSGMSGAAKNRFFKFFGYTLLEMMIVLSLFSLLLSIFFFWQRYLANEKDRVDKVKKPILEQRYAAQYLRCVFHNTGIQVGNKPPIFFSDDTSLIFTFDNGRSLDPALSHTVLGRLFFDAGNQSLKMGIWPIPDQEDFWNTSPSYCLPLLDKIETLEFAFYFPPIPSLLVHPEEIKKPVPQTGWQNKWDPAYEEIPLLVKIKFERRLSGADESIPAELIFDLPHSAVHWGDSMRQTNENEGIRTNIT